MPLWAAVAVVAAALVLRTLLRGWSFDRGDAFVFMLFGVVLVVTALVRRWVATHDDGDESHSDGTSDDDAEDPRAL